MPTTTKHFGKQVIGPTSRPYMLRYIIFRWGSLPRIYVHKFLRSDDERALHNHPWWFISIVLRGQYIEHTPDRPIHRRAASIAFRGLTHRHRVQLVQETVNTKYSTLWTPIPGREKPCWTLCVTGPDVRTWGFFCPDRFVSWQHFNGCE